MPRLTSSWAYALLIALTLALYANTLGHGYAFDDGLVITKNAFTTSGLAGLPDIFTQDAFVGALGDAGQVAGGRYRPLSVATFAIEWELFGEAPFVGHLVNVLFYALSVVLLYRLVERYLLPGRTWVAFLSAAIFAVHPLHTEVVANIKSRDELLVLLFLLLLLASLFRSLRTGRRAYLASLGWFVLALFSKETAVTYVAVIAGALWCFTELDLRRVLAKTAPYAVLALAFLVLRFSITGFSGAAGEEIINDPYLYATPAQEAGSIAFVLGKYLVLLIWPATLLHDYSFDTLPLRDLGDPLVWVSVLAYAGLALATGVGLARRRAWAFALALYLATLSIVSNIVVPVGAPMGERLMYVPSLGFALLLGLALERFVREDAPITQRRLALALAGAALALAGARTVLRNREWKDTETLTLTDVAVAPRNSKLQMGAAEIWARIAMRREEGPERSAAFERAHEFASRSLEIYPTYGDALFERALLNCYLGEADEITDSLRALHEHGRAHLVVPRTREPLSEELYRAGMNGLRAGAPAKARAFFEALLSFDPQHAKANAGIGGVLAAEGELAAAVAAFQRALAIDDQIVGAWAALGGCQFELGDAAAARAAWDRALQLDPANRPALEGLRLLGDAAGTGEGG